MEFTSTVSNLKTLLTERSHFIWLVTRNSHISLLNILKYLNCGHVRRFFDAIHLDNIFIRFGSKLYRQIVGIPIVGTNCGPLVADLFLFC